MNAQISCRASSYGKFESLAFEHLASLGIKNVEIIAPAADAVQATRAALAAHGLRALSMHGECDVTRADCGAQVAAQMPVFRALGTHYMFVSCKAGDVPKPAVYERLRAAGDAAAAADVTIIMETHPDLITNADVALETMRGVNHRHVRVNFDTANIHYYNENIDGVAELRRILPYVGALHLKETNGAFHTWHFPALGRGCVRFREIFATLRTVGFAGPLTMEIEGCEGDPETERLTCDRIAESVGFLRGLGVL